MVIYDVLNCRTKVSRNSALSAVSITQEDYKVFTHKFFRFFVFLVALLGFTSQTVALTVYVSAGDAVSSQSSDGMTVDLSPHIPCNWIEPTAYNFYLPTLNGLDGNGEFIIIANRSERQIPVRVILLRDDGSCPGIDYKVGRQLKIPVHGNPNTLGQKISAIVQVLKQGDENELSVEHTRFWGDGLQAGTNAQATEQLSSEWHFAEGVVSDFFQQTISIVNPSTKPVTVTFRYYNSSGWQYLRPVYLPAGPSRMDVDVNKELVGYSFSHSTQINAYFPDNSPAPIAVEREMTWNKRSEGHAQAGLVPSPSWFCAEGVKNPGFSTYLLIGNMNMRDVVAQVRFLHENGQEYAIDVIVPYQTRATVEPPANMPNGSFGCVVTSHNYGSIVVERSIYWGQGWHGGHNAAASNRVGQFWFFGEGTTGGPFQQFILLSSPTPYGADVLLKFTTSEGEISFHRVQVASRSRTTVYLNAIPSIVGKEFSTELIASRPIVAERSMYWGLSPDGRLWKAGHSSLGRLLYNNNPY
jgi:hypothetical protein